MKLKEIIIDLKELRTEERLKVSDEVLFDAGVRIFNSQNIRQGSKNISSFQQTTATPKSGPATEKQKNLLKKLKWKGDYNQLTKIKAMEEIDKRIG